MKSTLNELKNRVQAALVAAFGDEYRDTDPLLVGPGVLLKKVSGVVSITIVFFSTLIKIGRNYSA